MFSKTVPSIEVSRLTIFTAQYASTHLNDKVASVRWEHAVISFMNTASSDGPPRIVSPVRMCFVHCVALLLAFPGSHRKNRNQCMR